MGFSQSSELSTWKLRLPWKRKLPWKLWYQEATRKGSYTIAFEMSSEMESMANRKPGSSVELRCLSLN